MDNVAARDDNSPALDALPKSRRPKKPIGRRHSISNDIRRLPDAVDPRAAHKLGRRPAPTHEDHGESSDGEVSMPSTPASSSMRRRKRAATENLFSSTQKHSLHSLSSPVEDGRNLKGLTLPTPQDDQQAASQAPVQKDSVDFSPLQRSSSSIQTAQSRGVDELQHYESSAVSASDNSRVGSLRDRSVSSQSPLQRSSSSVQTAQSRGSDELQHDESSAVSLSEKSRGGSLRDGSMSSQSPLQRSLSLVQTAQSRGDDEFQHDERSAVLPPEISRGGSLRDRSMSSQVPDSSNTFWEGSYKSKSVCKVEHGQISARSSSKARVASRRQRAATAPTSSTHDSSHKKALAMQHINQAGDERSSLSSNTSASAQMPLSRKHQMVTDAKVTIGMSRSQSSQRSVSSGSSQRRSLSVQAKRSSASPYRRSLSVESPGKSIAMGQQAAQSQGGQCSAVDESSRRSRSRQRSRSVSLSTARNTEVELVQVGSLSQDHSEEEEVPTIESDSGVFQPSPQITDGRPRITTDRRAVQRTKKKRATAPSHQVSSSVAAKRSRCQTEHAGSMGASSSMMSSVGSRSRGHRRQASRSPRSAPREGSIAVGQPLPGSSARRRAMRGRTLTPLRRNLSASSSRHGGGDDNPQTGRQITPRSSAPRRNLSRHTDEQQRGLAPAESLGQSQSQSSSSKTFCRVHQARQSDPAIQTMMEIRLADRRFLQKAVLDSRDEEDAEVARRVGLARLSIALRDWRSYCAVSRICSDDDSGTSSSKRSSHDSDVASRISGSGSSSDSSMDSHQCLLRRERDAALMQNASFCRHGRSLGLEHDAPETTERAIRVAQLITGFDNSSNDDCMGKGGEVLLQVEAASEESFSRRAPGSCKSAEKEMTAGASGRLRLKGLVARDVFSENLLERPLSKKAFAFWNGSSDLVKSLSVAVFMIFTVVGVLSFVVILRLTEATL